MDRKLILFGKAGVNSLDRVVCIDPGLGGTGWAFWARLGHVEPGDPALSPKETGVLRPPKGERWQNQCHSLAASVAGMLRGFNAGAVVLEMPEVWAGSATGMASATHSAKEGEPADLCKLLYLVGVLGAAVFGSGAGLPILISPKEWKGQLAKDAIARRIMAALPGASFRDHEWDAVGMGLAAQGQL